METHEAQTSDLLAVRALLDEAMIGLRAVEDPQVHLLETRSYVSAALMQVYEALAAATQGGGDFRAHCNRALELSREALGALSFHPSMDPAVLADMRPVAQAIGLLAEGARPPVHPLQLPSGSGRPPLRATVAVPALHDPARGVLFPTIPLPPLEGVPGVEVDLEAEAPEPPPPVRTPEDFDALAAWEARVTQQAREETSSAPEPEPAELADPDAEALAAVFGVAEPPSRVVWRRGRGFFEDLAMMGRMRRPQGPYLWTDFETVERRLLCRVDALLACGPWILPRLVQLLEERPLPDPEMLWASVLLLGCVRGDDTCDQIERLARLVPADDEALSDALVDALWHAPHTGINGLARGWLEGSSPALRRVGVRVLGARRATMVETLRPLMREDDPALLRDVLQAMERIPGDLDPSIRSPSKTGYRGNARQPRGLASAPPAE